MLNLYHTIVFLPAVVVLESLNSALQKQESLTANYKVLWGFFQLIASQGQRTSFFFFSIWPLVIPLFCQSPLPTTETESSTDEQEHMQHSPAEESQQSSKRKRTPVDIGSEEDLDIDGIHPSLHIYPPRVVHIEKSQGQERFNPPPLFKYSLEVFLLPSSVRIHFILEPCLTLI